MRLIRLIVLGALFAILPAIATGSPANAQAIRTWVSGVGDDANPCSRTAPCKTFAGAISKTSAGGEISCLDSAGFGSVTITKSIAITCIGVIGGITSAGSSAIIVNAGANDVVMITGIEIEGGGSAVTGLNGIRFLAGAALHVEDCIIRGSHTAAPNGNGIFFVPSQGTAELTVTNTTIFNNGTASAGEGILIEPTASANTRVVIENSRITNNFGGVRVNGASSTGTNDVTIRNSVMSGASFGLRVFEGRGGASELMLEYSSASNNGRGIIASGAGAIVRLRNSTVAGNFDLGLVTTAGGQIISHGANVLSGNGANGAFTSTVAQQ